MSWRPALEGQCRVTFRRISHLSIIRSNHSLCRLTLRLIEQIGRRRHCKASGEWPRIPVANARRSKIAEKRRAHLHPRKQRGRECDCEGHTVEKDNLNALGATRRSGDAAKVSGSKAGLEPPMTLAVARSAQMRLTLCVADFPFNDPNPVAAAPDRPFRVGSPQQHMD